MVSVLKTVGADVTLALNKRGIPVLMETPAAADVEQLIKINSEINPSIKVQVAEQYFLQPLHHARLNYIKTNRLGNIYQATISFTQGYHAISLMRKYLGVQFENVRITAKKILVPSIAGPSRNGEPTFENRIAQKQIMGIFEFGEKTGIFNFENDQHRSWIRSQVIQIKGERGEIFNTDIKYLKDYRTPLYANFRRKNMGEDENLEGYGIKGIVSDGEWYYQNPFMNFRLSDDELAIATSLFKMEEYINGGSSFYSLAEASQDLYLTILMEQAADTETIVTSQSQIWSN